MKYIYHGASIECEGAEIVSRKINVGAIVDLPNVGVCRKYSCERNSETAVKKELYPKVPLYKNTSHLDLADELAAETIVVYVRKTSPLRIQKIDNTHRHNAQEANSNCYTFCEIAVIFPNITVLKDPRQQLPTPKKLLSEVKNKKD